MNTHHGDEAFNEADETFNEAEVTQPRGRGRNRGDDDQLADTVEQFGEAIDNHVYRQLERLTREEAPRQVVHIKRSERRRA